MEKRRFHSLIVLAITFLGLIAVARADAPSADAQLQAAPKTQARKRKRAVKAPKVSLVCKSDDDCAMTNMKDGDCCPSLCQPRAVSKASAEALEKYSATCAKPKGAECPTPSCAPSQITMQAACVSGKCAARAAASPARE